MLRPLLLPLLATAVTFALPGSISVEAEEFASQQSTGIRKWERKTGLDASGGAYLQALPDTRLTHDDKLIHGENFTDKPGLMAVLSYQVKFAAPGRYFVWVRAYSSGPEDNSIHVGLNGEWPASGQRMQWCEGKNQWTWASKQRTAANHCGEPGKIWLDVPTAGEHTVQFSMREDGFRFDRFLLTTDPGFAPSAANHLGALTPRRTTGPYSETNPASLPRTRQADLGSAHTADPALGLAYPR